MTVRATRQVIENLADYVYPPRQDQLARQLAKRGDNYPFLHGSYSRSAGTGLDPNGPRSPMGKATSLSQKPWCFLASIILTNLLPPPPSLHSRLAHSVSRPPMPTDRLSLVLTVNDDTDMSTHSSTTLCLIYKLDIPFSNHSIYTGKLSWSDVQETHKAVDESIFVVAPRPF